jgi:hypothetical protein
VAILYLGSIRIGRADLEAGNTSTGVEGGHPGPGRRFANKSKRRSLPSARPANCSDTIATGRLAGAQLVPEGLCSGEGIAVPAAF